MSAEAPTQLRKLAIVPAYNEAEMVGRVVRDIRRQAPDFDVVVDRRRIDRQHRRPG